MKILVEISCEDYDSLLNRVTEESPVYPTLKNGLKIRSTEADKPPEMIMIVCEEDEATCLLRVSKELCPEAASQIEESIKLSRPI